MTFLIQELQRSLTERWLCMRNRSTERWRNAFENDTDEEWIKDFRMSRQAFQRVKMLVKDEMAPGIEDSGEITRRQYCLIFIHNCVPFIGFGFLDNAIMICAGEYIDHTIGLWLGISTMAAAAIGNLISDIAGIGLAGYVEIIFLKFGLPVAALTPEQAEQWKTIFSSNLGKGFGIFVGCILGMFPLLFIKKKEKDENLN